MHDELKEEESSTRESEEYPFEKDDQNRPTSLIWFAMFLAACALVIAIINTFNAKDKKDTEAFLTEVSGRFDEVFGKFDEVSGKFDEVSGRLDNMDERIVNVDQESRAEKAVRGKLELQKAIINFQQAKELIEDPLLEEGLSKIEDELKLMLYPAKMEEIQEGVKPEAVGNDAPPVISEPKAPQESGLVEGSEDVKEMLEPEAEKPAEESIGESPDEPVDESVNESPEETIDETGSEPPASSASPTSPASMGETETHDSGHDMNEGHKDGWTE